MWTEEERGIFKFMMPDGTERFADPLRVRRELILGSNEKFDGWWNEYILPETPEIVKARLETYLVDTMRAAFKIESSENSVAGIDDENCLRVLNQYLAWMEQKKTSNGKPLAPSPASAGPPEWAGSTTKAGSGLFSAKRA